MNEDTNTEAAAGVPAAQSAAAPAAQSPLPAGARKPHYSRGGDRAPRREGGFRSDAPRGERSGGFGAGKPRKSRRDDRNRHAEPIKAFLKRPEDKIPPAQEGVIRIIPLGGVEEIGKNMTAIEYDGEIIVVDAGIQFSTEDTPGIDYMIPNIKYLEDRKDKIKALVITHGHLDHIGGIPFIIDKIGNPPVYTREFGALLIKKRQVEFPHLPELDLKIVGQDDGAIQISKHMKVRFFGLTHSIPDSTGIIIETPFGDIVNTGDVRVDNQDGIPSDKEIEQYSIFQKRNVLLLTVDSTGIDKPGWSLPESRVIETVDKIAAGVPGRLLIATFASQVERILEFLKIAKKYGKKVVIEGRSMKNNIEIIRYLKLGDVDHVIPVEEVEQHPPHKIMMLATGAQGEEFAALMRIANKSHKQIRLGKLDTVILSSSVIPGNERAIDVLKDNLYRHDCKIITYLDTDVHTSGHGKRAELEWIHRAIPHKFFMPVHGQHYRLKMHAELEKNLGVNPDTIVVPDNGSIVEIYDQGTKIRVLKEKAPSTPMMVDGFAIGDVQEVVIRDRHMLAEDGVFMIVALVDTNTGRLKKSPDIISRGFVYLRESQELLRHARILIKQTIEDSSSGMKPINFDFVKTQVSDNVSRYLFQKTNKHPIVIPVIITA